MRSMVLMLALVAPAAQAQVVINEVLFDSDNVNGDDGYEWIELYNAGTSAVDLNGYALEAGTSAYSNVITFATVTIQPGAFLVVGESMVTERDVLATMNLGNASNADAIRLLDNSGTPVVLDVVVYGSTNSDNWEDESGTVWTTTAPTGSAGTSIARMPDGEDTGDLSADFEVALVPTPGVTNVPPCEASTGTVTINEFLADPAGTDSTELREWVELYSTAAVNLEGWSIERFSQPDNHAAIFTFDDTHSIASTGYFLLGETNVASTDAVSSGTLGLYAGTGGDGLRLVDCQGSIVDTVVYGTSNTDLLLDDSGSVATSLAPDPGGDDVLARISDGSDTDASGVDFVVATTATPGAANPVIQPPTCVADPGGAVTINEFMVNPEGTDGDVLMEYVELHSTTAIDLEGWQLERFSQVDNFGVIATLTDLDAVLANDFFVIGEAGRTSADHITSSAMGLYGGSDGDGLRLLDCEGSVVDTVIYGGTNTDGLIDDDGSVATSIAGQPGSDDVLARREDGIDTNDSGADFWVTNQPTLGATNPTAPPPPNCTAWDGSTGLVINEFLPDPAGADGTALGEWIEIYNPGSAGVDLEGWMIERFSQVDNHSVAATVPATATIAAGGHLVIGEANVSAADVVVTGTIGLYGGTDGDGLRLVDCEGTVLDTVVYAGPNDDGLIDDSGSVATSLAPKAGSDQSVARVLDGQDTDLSGDDFVVSSAPTPGDANPEIICVPGDGSVVINEVLTDPAGTDGDAATEFIELFNSGSAPAVIDGWWLVAAGQDDDVTPDVVIPPATTIAPGGYFVIGNFNVPEADIVDVFSVPNGSGGDFVRLFDCDARLIDTVVYGSDNDDGIVDDNGSVPDVIIGAPDDDQTVARVEDGVDTNSVDDWSIRAATPGITNFIDPVDIPDDSGGCNRNRDPGSGGDPGGGCAVMPLGGVELALLPLVALRRRRD